MSNKCVKCDKAAYQMEQIIFDKKTYHKSCLRCAACNAVQTSLKNVCNMNNDIYCKSCFTKAFRTKGSYNTIEQVSSPKPDGASSPVPTEEAAPVVEEKKEEVAPVVVEEKKEEVVVVEEAAPVVEEAAPVVEEAAPVVEEVAPVVEEAAPVVEEVAPVVVEEVAPVVEEKKEEVVVEIKKEAAPEAQPESVKELVFEVVDEDEIKPLPTTETPAFLSPKTEDPAPRGRLGSVAGRTASMSIGGTAKCKKCDKAAYAMESVQFDNSTYHKSCLRCSACNAVQTSLKNVCNMNNDIYCKSCFTKAFRTKGSYNTIEQVASPTAQ